MAFQELSSLHKKAHDLVLSKLLHCLPDTLLIIMKFKLLINKASPYSEHLARVGNNVTLKVALLNKKHMKD